MGGEITEPVMSHNETWEIANRVYNSRYILYIPEDMNRYINIDLVVAGTREWWKLKAFGSHTSLHPTPIPTHTPIPPASASEVPAEENV